MLYFYLSFVISGLLSWNVDLTVCDLNKELQLFETRHTAQFSEQVKGQSDCFFFISTDYSSYLLP